MTGILTWWLVLQLCTVAALPLAWRLFARLPGRGYPLAKALGLLLITFLLWLGGIFHLLPNDPGGVAASLLVVAGASWWLGRDGLRQDGTGARPLAAWLRERWRLVLVTELLFAAVLVGWSVFRSYNPEISGTEKPMEFAFINGVLAGRFFPPQDPWLSGYAISYYYFGYVMLGALIRITGADPAVGFNLGVAMWYALVMTGAFGIAYDLVVLGARRAGGAGGEGKGIAFGLVGALFTGVLGNLEGVLDTAYHRGLLPLDWLRWLDIKDMFESAPTGGWTGGFWWWWRASRVIHDRDLLGNTVEVIDEFPFFSFLLGDMHPHVLALPFALLAIALALNLLVRAAGGSDAEPGGPQGETGAGPRAALLRGAAAGAAAGVDAWRLLGRSTGLGSAGVILYGVLIGALGFLNTWDFPVYLLLAVLGFGAGLALRRGLSWWVAGRAALAGVYLGVIGWLAYFPFYIGFQSQLGGLLPNLLFPSRFSQFFVMFGLFLVIAFFFLVLLTFEGREQRHARRSLLAGTGVALVFSLLVPLLLLAAIILALVVLPAGRAFVQELLNNPAVQAGVGDASLRGLLGLVARLRLAAPWTYLVLAVGIAWTAGLIWVRAKRVGSEGAEGSAAGAESAAPPARQADLFGLLLIGLALVMALLPEFIYLRDLFGSRMNTVFKFYYQAWTMLALAAAYGLSRISSRSTPWLLKAPAWILAGCLVLAGLWYPVAAIPSKAENFAARPDLPDWPTLDGLVHLRVGDPAEMAAIEWLRANVPPAAVVVTASGGSYESAGRISMATGNPTLLGWEFHERQWRGTAFDSLTAGRLEALDAIYRSARGDELLAVLDRWNVAYVYVGQLERGKYGIGEASLGRLDQALELVFDQGGVRIYAR